MTTVPRVYDRALRCIAGAEIRAQRYGDWPIAHGAAHLTFSLACPPKYFSWALHAGTEGRKHRNETGGTGKGRALFCAVCIDRTVQMHLEAQTSLQIGTPVAWLQKQGGHCDLRLRTDTLYSNLKGPAK